MNNKEMLAQKRLEAKIRQSELAKKSKNVVAAGNLPSQWGKSTNINRLIICDHMVKSGAGATRDYLREEYRKAKKAVDGTKIVRVEKRGKV